MSRLPLTLVALCAAAVAGPRLAGADQKAEAAAVSGADAWLAVVDQGRYSESWSAAASLFKRAVTKDDWAKAMATSREPLGKVVSRKLKSRQYAESLPGAPDGKYVVIQYDTVFENKRAAVETVTPMLDADGAWRVSGYYIR